MIIEEIKILDYIEFDAKIEGFFIADVTGLV